MDDGQRGAAADLGHAADIAGRDQGCTRGLDIGHLAVAQAAGDFRLHDVVGSGRTAAQVPLPRFANLEAGPRQQLFRLAHDLLAVLHRAGRMIGDREARTALRLRQVERGQIFGHVPRQRRDARGLVGIGRVEPQHVAVILDRGATARCGDDDRVERPLIHLARPRVDIVARRRECRLLLAHVVDERAATRLAFRDDDLDAETVQEPDRRLVDRRVEHGLRATGQKRDAATRRTGGRVAPGPRYRRNLRDRRRRKAQHGGDGFEPRYRREDAGEGSPERRELQRRPEPRRIGQNHRQRLPDQPVEQRAPVGPVDVGAGVIDQVHVVHAGRAGRHAGEAGQAAVDMGDDFPVGRASVLQHVLDQVDAPARAVELVAQRHIGRAGRGAEAAMHAFAQDAFGFRDMRVGELLGREGGLHGRRVSFFRSSSFRGCGSARSSMPPAGR